MIKPSDIPRVSIIIPVYGTERYLRQCLESVVNQTLREIEIIVVNDCSPDNSEQIIAEYAIADPRIVYVRHAENLGPGGARNTGIVRARGEFIGSVDSDDFVDSKTFETAVRRCLEDGTDIAMFLSVRVDDNSRPISRQIRYPRIYSYPRIYQVKGDNLARIPPEFYLKIYRRSLLERHNVRFPERLFYEDDEFRWKLFGSALPRISIIKEPFYFYRKRFDGSSIMDNKKKTRRDHPKVLLNAMRFLSSNGSFADVRRSFVENVITRLRLIELVDRQYRRDTFETIKTLLTELAVHETEIADKAVFDQIQLIRTGGFDDYLNWLVDSVESRGNEMIREIYGSTSWKVTAPLRAMAKMFDRAVRSYQRNSARH